MRPGSERFVLVGLATSRSTWLARLSSWVTSGAVAAELVRCLTLEEFRATLRSRRVSVALLDEMSRHADRDLLSAVRAAGGAAVVVVGAHPRRDWAALGADTTLAEDFDLGTLTDLLRTRALPVSGTTASDADAGPARRRPSGHLVAVCGPGGTGASTVACALAQGLAGAPGGAGSGPGAGVDDGPVALVDMALNGEQAVLHGMPPTSGGLPALVEAHRRGSVDPAALDGYVAAVAERGYLLLTGLHRRRAWSAIRPRALHTAVSALRSRFAWVVADTDSDVEGEPDSGSLDVEERNAMSRCALGQAAAVVVVGAPGVKGAYALLRTIEDLAAFGVAPERMVPVVNRGPTGRRGRAEVAGALRELATPAGVRRPVFLPDRDVERALVDAAALPGWLVDPVVPAVRELVGDAGEQDGEPQPELVAPGSLAYWDKHEGALPA